MADYGHDETDKILALIEKRVAAVYKQASEEMKQKLEKWYKDFERLDKQKAALVEAGKMGKAEYLAWRKGKMADSGRLKALVDTLTEDFVNSDKIAMEIVRGGMTNVYALNANYAAYSVEKDANVNLSWTLYDHSTVERMLREDPDALPLPSVNVPLDERWNRRHLNNAITQGILQGESIPHIADRLQNILGMDRTAAVRSARTATTAVECAGRTDTYKRAEKMGIQLKQQWVATLDGKTRHAHRQLDGQTVDVGQPFSVDGYELDYPGDPKAPGYLIYNCRCTIISVDKFHDPNAPRVSKLGGVSYEEWKKGKEVAEGNRWGTYSKNSENSQKNVDNSAENGIINIGRSLGAKAKNYDIKLPDKEVVHLTEGTSITKVNTIAGKGRNRKIDMIDALIEKYPGTNEDEWTKKKGIGYIDYDGESYKAELHWYEEPSIGRVEWKVKPDADGNWFIEDD